MPTTLRNTDILFNDGTTQSTAASPVPASITAVGSILFVANWSTSNLIPGNTIAGSSLLYVTGLSSANNSNGQISVEANVLVSLWASSRLRAAEGGLIGDRPGNQGVFQPSNTATLPGTWRILAAAPSRYVAFDGYLNFTSIIYYSTVAQRIS